LTVTATSGVYVLTDGTDYAVLPFGASNTEIQEALDGFRSIGVTQGVSGNVKVTPGSSAGSFTIAPSGILTALPSLDVATTADAYIDGNTLTVLGSGGAYVLSDGADYAALPFNATAKQIEEALANLASINGDVTVTSTSPAFAGQPVTFDIELTGGSPPTLQVVQDDGNRGKFAFNELSTLGASLSFTPSAEFSMTLPITGKLVRPGLNLEGTLTVTVPPYNVFSPRSFLIASMEGFELPTLSVPTAAAASLDADTNRLTVGGIAGSAYVLTVGTDYAALPKSDYTTKAATAIRKALENFVSIRAGQVTVTAVATVAATDTEAAIPGYFEIVGASGLRVAQVAGASISESLLTVSGSSGAYVLTDGTDYVALPYNATPARIQAALESFSAIEAGGIAVRKTTAPQFDLALSGSMTVGDFFHARGDFAFSSTKGDLVRIGGSEFSGANYVVAGGENINIFAGNAPAAVLNSPDFATQTQAELEAEGAVGLLLSDVSFNLLIYTDKMVIEPVTYTALNVAGASASFIGVEGLTMAVTRFEASLNKTSDGDNPNRVLDFNSGGEVQGREITTTVGPDFDFEGENGSLLNVSGDVAIQAFGYVTATASFAMSREIIDVDTNGNGENLEDATLLMFELDDVNLFAGVGGAFTTEVTALDTSNATGFEATGGSLGVAIITADQKAGPDNRSYLAITSELGSGVMLGLPDGVEISGSDIVVEINRAFGTIDGQPLSASASALDWTSVLDLDSNSDFGEEETDTLTFFAGAENATALTFSGELTHVAGKLNLKAYDVLEANATFDMLSQIVDSVNIDAGAGSAALTDARLLLLNLTLVDPDDLSSTRLTVTGTSGDYVLSDGTDTTNPLAYDADANTIQAALEELSSIGVGNVSVISDPDEAGSFIIKRQGSLADLPMLTFPVDTKLAEASLTIATSNGPKRGLAIGVPGGIGFAVDSGSLTYGLVRANADPSKSPIGFTGTYSSLTTSVNGLTLNGLPDGIDFTAETLKFTQNTANIVAPNNWLEAIDWSQFTVDVGDLAALTNPGLSIGGTLTLDINGFVLGSGSFSFDQTRNQIVSDGVNLSVAAAAEATFTSGTGVLEVTGASGAYVLTDGIDYVALPYDTSAAGIQAALEGFASIGIGNVTVTSDDNQTGPFTILPVGPFVLPVNLAVAGNAVATFTDETLDVTGGSGVYVLTDGTSFSALPFDAISDDIETALNGFTNLGKGDVTVTADPNQAGSFTISASLTGMTVQSIAISDVNLFVGVDGAFSSTLDTNGNPTIDPSKGTGFKVENANLDLVTVSETTGQLRSWSALRAQIAEMTVQGLPDPDFSLAVLSLELLYNGADGVTGSKLNWQSITDQDFVGTNGSSSIGTIYSGISNTTDFSVGGTLSLNLGGFVIGVGSFEMSKRSGLAINDGNLDLTNASELLIKLTNVSLFVGTGGPSGTVSKLETKTSGDTMILEGETTVAGVATPFSLPAVGFFIGDANLDLAILKEDPAIVGSRSWVGLAASIDEMIPLGMPTGFEASVSNLNVFYNAADSSSDSKRLNWKALAEENGDDYGLDNTRLSILTEAISLSVSGAMLISIEGYVHVSGSIALEKKTLIAKTGANETEMSTLAFGANDLRSFVGTGGPYFQDIDGDGQLGWAFNTGGGNDASRTITSGSVTLAINGVSTTYDHTEGQNILPVNTVVTLGANDAVEVNGATYGDRNDEGTVGTVDVGETAELNAGALGVSMTIDEMALVLMKPVATSTLSYYALKASGSAELIGVDDVTLSGRLNISINRGSDSNSMTGDPRPDAINFLASASVNAASTESYGDATGLKVTTGPDPDGAGSEEAPSTIIDFETDTLSVSGFVSLGISEFVHASGNFAIEKANDKLVNQADGGTVTLAGGAPDTGVSVLTIGASNVKVFVGTGGPYFQDIDGDGQLGWAFNTGGGNDASRTITSGSVTLAINGVSTTYDHTEGQNILPVNTVVTLGANDAVEVNGATYGDRNDEGTVGTVDVGETAELNAGATGVSVTVDDFGLALMRSATASYYALEGVGSGRLVGVEDVQLDVRDLMIQVNDSKNNSANAPPVVVDIKSTFGTAGLAVPTGPNPAGEIVLGGVTDTANNFSKSNFSASGAVTLKISDKVYASGSLAFTKGVTATATLSDGTTKEVSVLKVGGTGITAFFGTFGTSGPYETDGTTLRSDSKGLSIPNVSFGLAFLTPTDSRDSSRYYGVNAGIDGDFQIGGVSGITLGDQSEHSGQHQQQRHGRRSGG
jgi:hypothetical protein